MDADYAPQREIRFAAAIGEDDEDDYDQVAA